MNQQILNGKWKEIKGEIQKTWGNITGDELEKTKGNLKSISGIIEQRYGHKKEEVGEKLDTIYSKFGQKTEQMKKEVAGKSDDLKKEIKGHK